MNFKTHLKIQAFFKPHLPLREPYCFLNYFINAALLLSSFQTTMERILISCLVLAQAHRLFWHVLENWNVCRWHTGSTKIISGWCDQLKKKGNDYGSSCQHNLKTDEYKKSFACFWSPFYYGYLSMDHHKIVCLALILLSREKISRSQCQ